MVNNDNIGRGRALRIAFGITMLVLLLAGSAGAATLTVCQGGCIYSSIQAAVDASSNGDTIMVHSGTYFENVNVSKQLTLRGESNLTTIIEGNGSGNIVEVNANGVVIDGCRIQNGSNGIYVNSNSNVISNNVIMDMSGVQGVYNGGNGGMSSGIYLFGSINNTLRGNTIGNINGGTGGEGIETAGATGGLSLGIYLNDSPNTIITVNTISTIIGGIGGATNRGYRGAAGGAGGLSSGIYLSNSPNTILTVNTINNIMGGTGGAMNGSVGTGGGSGGLSTGLYLSSSPNTTLTGNTMRNISGGTAEPSFNPGTGGLSSGIYLNDTINNIFTDNNISHITGGGGGQSQEAYGIYLKTDSYRNIIYPNNTIDGDPIIYLYETNGEIIENYVLTANNNPTNLGKIVLINSRNIILRNNTIINMKGEVGVGGGLLKGSTGGLSSGIYLSGSTNNTLIGNMIKNIIGGNGETTWGVSQRGGVGGLSSGIYLTSSPNNTLINNRISNIEGGMGGRGGASSSHGRDGGIGGLSSGISLNDSTNSILIGNRINIIVGGIGGASGGTDGPGGSGGLSSGIYLTDSTNITLTDNMINSTTGGDGGTGSTPGAGGPGGLTSGIYITDSTSSTLTNNMISNMTGGIGGNGGAWGGGIGGLSSGIYVSSSTNNTLSNNAVNDVIGGAGGARRSWIGGSGGVSSGLHLYSSTNNILKGNTISNMTGGAGGTGNGSNGLSSGINLSSSINNTLNGNSASNNNYGISLISSSNNTIYNNIFNNSNNVLFNDSNVNTWNITRQPGTNIIGGPYLGGNFWAYPNGTGFSQQCEDVNKDGICDLAYSLDYLPLAYNATNLTPSITVVSPDGAENWERDIMHTITWNYTGSPGTYVMIGLLKNGLLDRVINSSTSVGSSGSGSYNWVINSTQTLDSDYKVKITSTDNSGYSDTSNNNFTISSSTPIANCGPDKPKCENVGAPVQFNGSASYDPDGAVVSYYWDFGDGTNATGAAPKHTYSSYKWNGTAYEPFIVNLTVTDDSGLTNSTSQKVVIWMAGDANGDGKVNILDASVVGLKWNGNDPCSDLNNDGTVNMLDANIIELNWGKIV